MHQIRVGFIGAGGNTRLRHLPGFAGIADVELVAVANRSVSSAERVAQEFQIGRVESDWREIIAAADIDAVCIGTWPNTHAEMTCAALKAGKHVLVEARMAATLAEAQEMFHSASARPEQVTQIVPSPITLEADEIIRNMISSGALGELKTISSNHTTAATLDSSAPLSWRMDHRISGINTMALGICYEPIQRWLDGDAQVLEAKAEILTPSRPDSDGSSHQVRIPEELHVSGAWGNAALVMHQSSVAEGPPRCTYEIVGDKGELHYDVPARELRFSRIGAPSVERIELPEKPDGGWRVEQDFIQSIRSGEPVRLTDFETGLRYMKFTDDVWQAWNQADAT